ncbi:MAG: 3'-5' exonuclease [bacterium]|nr:3'-5' exonuclease [bacterium]
MNYIVIDLEWNQGAVKEQVDPAMPFEIIEIGALKLNEQFRMVSQFNYLIKPKKYKKIHHKTEELTHISTQELNMHGRDFKKVIQEFFNWCGKDYIFCTWGTMDLTELERNIRFYGLHIPFPKPLLYYDLQRCYSVLHRNGTEKIALDMAVDELGLSKKRPFHRAKDDAYYTARVMLAMDFEKVKDCYSLDYYRIPSEGEEMFVLPYKDSIEFVSRPYLSKEEMMADKNLTTTECWKCKKRLRKKIHWFTPNSKQYMALAQCPVHGYMVGKIRIRKTDDDQFFAIKTLHFTDEEGAEEIRLKQKDMHKKRRQKLSKHLKKMDVMAKENKLRVVDGEVIVINKEGQEKSFVGSKICRRRILNLKQDETERFTWNVASRR